MKFVPCKADPDLWMRDAGHCYEYVCDYVDDIMAMMVDPENFFKELEDIYGYKLKGVGLLSYHLGGDFYHYPDGTLVWGAKTYMKRMLDNYKQMFGDTPRPYSLPVEKDDLPELDDSPKIDQTGIKLYQSLIGALQWCTTLGHFDIAVSVMTMSRFIAAPREGHIKRLQHILGYLSNTWGGGMRFRTGIPKNKD